MTLPLSHALAEGPYETQTRLTQIAMAVDPGGLIADEVCPRLPTGYKFTYTTHDSGDILRIPDVRASRAGALNEVEFGTSDATVSSEDYGLIDPVPARDMDEALKQMTPVDPLANAAARLAVLLRLAREKRVADLLTAAGSYASGHATTLSGSSQWSHASANPISAILDALDTCIVRPNVLILGQAVWTKLRQHAKVVEAVKLSGAGAEASGVVMAGAVAALLEIDRVLIGRAWNDTGTDRSEVSAARLWGKHAALIRVERGLTGPQSAAPTFCFTGQAQPMQVGTYEAPGRGINRGSTVVKVSESCKEVVSWNDAGYLWRAAAA